MKEEKNESFCFLVKEMGGEASIFSQKARVTSHFGRKLTIRIGSLAPRQARSQSTFPSFSTSTHAIYDVVVAPYP